MFTHIVHNVVKKSFVLTQKCVCIVDDIESEKRNPYRFTILINFQYYLIPLPLVLPYLTQIWINQMYNVFVAKIAMYSRKKS